MKSKIFLVPVMALFFSACASTPHTESALVHEAKKEVPTEGAEDTQAKLVDILTQESSLTASERSQLLGIVEAGYKKVREFDVLANQKKALLVREYTQPNPDKHKVKLAQAGIKKLHSKKIDEFMRIFDKMSVVMKLHPESSAQVMSKSLREIDRL